MDNSKKPFMKIGALEGASGFLLWGVMLTTPYTRYLTYLLCPPVTHPRVFRCIFSSIPVFTKSVKHILQCVIFIYILTKEFSFIFELNIKNAETREHSNIEQEKTTLL
jgi:hypothetical protein